MTCQCCSLHQARPLSGAYSLRCVECCSRLVLSAHPSKHLAAGHLAAIERFKGNPGREKVLESVRRELERRRLAGARSTPA